MELRSRQPNWRTLLIDDLIASNRRIPAQFKDDAFIKESLPFRRALRDCQNSKFPTLDILKLEEAYPDYLTAHQVATSSTMDRYFLEALIVANVPVGQIAKKTGFSKETIKLFEALYFDVRKRLKQSVYIMANLLGPLFDYTSEDHHDHLWKAIGFFCGADALDAIWTLGQTSVDASQKLASMLRNRLLSEATAASFSRKPGQSNAGFILESYVNAAHLDIAKETASVEKEHTAAQDDYLSTIQGAILDNMKLSLKPQDKEPTQVEGSLSNQGGDPKTDGYSRPVAFGGTGDEESVDDSK